MPTFKEQMVLDMAIFINPLEFAEPVLYNGSATGADGGILYAVPSIGKTDANGNTIVTEGSSDRATFLLSKTQLTSWKSGDIITHNSKSWYVLRCLNEDSASIKLECNSGESVF